MAKTASVDMYIAGAPEQAREKLEQIRQIIKDEAPEAAEKLSYGMPYYSLNGRLVYFAYFKDHVSLFAMPSAMKKFEKETAKYHRSKATLGFAYDKPLPTGLIRRMVKFRVAEQRAKAK
jgi:uncharacterized protein YdhG (YjbR/CyaY superfamily)